jgi:uncharacterized protein
MSALAALAVAAGAAAQAVTGMGFALIGGPLLVTLLGPVPGVRAVVTLSLLVNVLLLVREWRGADLRAAVTLGVPALLVTPVAAAGLRRLDTGVATVAAGLVTLLAVAALAVGLRWHAARGRAGAAAAGAVSAVMNVVAGIGGPAAVLYAANAGWPVARVRPTLQVYFLAVNVVTLAALGLPRPALGGLALVGALALGIAGGGLVAGHVPETWARRATLALAAAGGVVAVVRGLTG